MHGTEHTLEAILRGDERLCLVAHNVDELRLIRGAQNRVLANPQYVALVTCIL
jgi:ribosomal protein L7Ae-like RNA K-turn-binding protein